MYRYYNANPQNNFIDDCVIRSISIAEGRTWDEVYEELSMLARRKGLLFSSAKFVEDYLDERYDREYPKAKTVGEFVETHPKGVYLITMRGHISVAFYGTVLDSFDCSNREIFSVWRVR